MRRIPRLAEVERRYILSVLALCANNRTRTAEVLGVSLRGLRLKLHEYANKGFGVPPPLPPGGHPQAKQSPPEAA